MAQLTVKLKVRWWLKYWMYIAVTVNHFTGWRPTESQVEAVARRACYIVVAK